MNKTNGGGLGILGTLTVIFIVLKLVGVINWSWFAVLSPIVVPVCLFMIIFFIFVIIIKARG